MTNQEFTDPLVNDLSKGFDRVLFEFADRGAIVTLYTSNAQYSGVLLKEENQVLLMRSHVDRHRYHYVYIAKSAVQSISWEPQ